MKRILILLIFCFLPLNSYAWTERAYDWFWFLYEQDSSDRYASMSVRPFYLKNTAPGLEFRASLMPVLFWQYRTSDHIKTNGLLGLCGSVEYVRKDGIKDIDKGLFPLFFFGNGVPENKQDSYFMFWPFGGTLKGKLGYDRISAAVFPGVALFFLFPPAGTYKWLTGIAWGVLSFVPVYASWERKDYRAYGFFWPLFMCGKSRDRDEMRIMPFYAHSRKNGWYSRHSFFMICNYSEEYFSNHTNKTFFLFPLFGRKWSTDGHMSAAAVLWPFFSWGKDRKKGSSMINMPWPLVQIGEDQSQKMKKMIFFPFFGKYSRGHDETLFITPFFFKLSKKTASYESEYYTNCLIVWWHKRNYLKPDRNEGAFSRFFKIWPLLSVEYNEKGDFFFKTLSLLPFRDREGYERMYDPLWSLFEYRKFSDGEKRAGILLRTYYQRWGKDFFQNGVPFIFSYRSLNGRTVDFSFCLSMFGYSHRKEGKFLKLFWLPVRIGDSDEKLISLQAERDRLLERQRWQIDSADAMRSEHIRSVNMLLQKKMQPSCSIF